MTSLFQTSWLVGINPHRQFTKMVFLQRVMSQPVKAWKLRQAGGHRSFCQFCVFFVPAWNCFHAKTTCNLLVAPAPSPETYSQDHLLEVWAPKGFPTATTTAIQSISKHAFLDNKIRTFNSTHKNISYSIVRPYFHNYGTRLLLELRQNRVPSIVTHRTLLFIFQCDCNSNKMKKKLLLKCPNLLEVHQSL